MRRADGRPRLLHRGFGLRLLLQFIVQLALRNGTLRGHGRIALHINLRQNQLRLRLAKLAFSLPQLPFSLIERCLKRPRIDLEEHMALFHLRAFAVVLPH